MVARVPGFVSAVPVWAPVLRGATTGLFPGQSPGVSGHCFCSVRVPSELIWPSRIFSELPDDLK